MNAHNGHHQAQPVHHHQVRGGRFSRVLTLLKGQGKIPLVAQISGVLSLLVIGAGLLTANQLSQTSQNLRSSAVTGTASLAFEPAVGELAFGQEKQFAIQATTTNDLSLTAAILHLMTANSDKIEVTAITPNQTLMPFIIRGFAPGPVNQSLAQWSIVQGAINNDQLLAGKNTIATVTVKAKQVAGEAVLDISPTTEIAAIGNSENVYDNSVPGRLTLTIVDNGTTPPPGEGSTATGVCVGKTARKVSGATPQQVTSQTPLAPNASVVRGNSVEYSVTITPTTSTEKVTVIDTLPAHLEYIAGSEKLDGAAAGAAATVNNNTITFSFNLAENRRGENHTFTYRTKVKADAPLTDFRNAAKVLFNEENNDAGSCSINLKVTESTTPLPPPPPPGEEPPPLPNNALIMNLGFRVQGVTKRGIIKSAEVILKYTSKSTGETVITQPYNHTFASTERSRPNQDMVYVMIPEPYQSFVITDIDLNDVDFSTSTLEFPQGTATGIEVYVKMHSSLRKRVGELVIEGDISNIGSAPIVLSGIFDSDESKLMIGDYDRSGELQTNVIRASDIGRMLSQFTEISHSVTSQNVDYDIDNNGVLNMFDVSLLLSNLTDISVTGDEP